jgi:DNA polymerase-3 subunit gamma/tau
LLYLHNMKKDTKKGEAHVALYRKYRPSNFAEVVGQDHIVKAIEGALKAGKVSHAYLLSGPRGTGKTTIARIIANVLGTSPSDIYEMDGASNRKIEDARDIKENVRTLPFDSKYKVYILDEVHMLTKEAWNALLKTIEEPPEHAIFILATTEIDKVPETIVSRCQTFVFKKPTDTILTDVVTKTAKSEGYKIAEGGAELIALLGDGSFRDTLSTLDKVVSFAKTDKIELADIIEVTGAPDITLVKDFITALANNDIESGFSVIHKAGEQNIEMKVYIKMILSMLRYALILRYAPGMKNKVASSLSDTDMEYLVDIVAKKPEHISSRSLSILLEAYQSLRYSFISELPLELALVSILNNEK